MYNPYNQQAGGFNSQQTGFSGGNNQQPLNSQQSYPQFQQTGYYQAPAVQPQSTGFYPQQGMYQPGIQGQATGFSQPQPQLQQQQTGYIQTMPTGFQQADHAPITVVENSELKIPSIRISFISAEDQGKYEHLFRTAVPKGEQAISGDAASNILLRSGLPPVTLAEIWSLADINKSGSLLFPEFALSLHLCGMAKRGESLPTILPEKWSNEVRSFVDAINFSIPDDPSSILNNTPFANVSNQAGNSQSGWNQPQTNSYAPPTTFNAQATGFIQGNNFNSLSQTGYQNSTGLQPQSTGLLPSSIQSQRTGGNLIPLQPQQTAGLIPAQKTGPLQSQGTGYNAQFDQSATNFLSNGNGLAEQKTGLLQQQSTGFQPSIVPQQTGSLSGPATGAQIKPQGTGYQFNNGSLNQQPTGIYNAPLQSQQTGFANQQLQPQSTGFAGQQLQPQSTGFTGQPLSAQLTGKPGEWGFVSMPTGGIPGLNAMEQHFLPSSQLPSHNLQNAMGGSLKSNVTWAITKQEKQIYDGIFNAWDTSRRGYVDGDVALKVFGKSGLGRPDLESIWTLADTNDSGKLNKDEFAVAMHLVYRRLNGFELPLRLPAELIPPSTKYIQDSMDSLKSSLKKTGTYSAKASSAQNKGQGSRFKNDDNNVGYISNSRHRRRQNEDGSSDKGVSSDNTNLSIEDLKKSIREKKILLDAIDAEEEDTTITNKRIVAKNLDEIEIMKSKIKSIQQKLDQKGNASERSTLLSKLNELTTKKVPSLIQNVHKVNQDIAKYKVELIKLKLSKENPNWQPGSGDAIVGTGPNGEVTESDKKKFRSKQLLKQRMLALTGKSNGSSDIDSTLEQERNRADEEYDKQTEIVKSIESSIKELEDSCSVNLKLTNSEIHGGDKWENGNGVSPETSRFIQELKSRDSQKSFTETKGSDRSNKVQQNISVEQKANAETQNINTSNNVKSTISYNSPEERAAYIKAQAEKKMNERLAKLGISRNRNKTTSAPSSGQVVDQPGARSSVNGANTDSKTVTSNNVNDEVKVEVSKTPLSNDTKDEEGSDNEEDDEEYKALLKQKQEMEAREAERKLKKKQQKEARLAQIRKEMDDLRKQQDSGSEDEEEKQTSESHKVESSEQVKTVHPQTPSSSYKESQVQKESISEPKGPNGKQQDAIPSSSRDTGSQSLHDNNPFQRKDNPPSQQSFSDTNPFFKRTTSEAKVDPEKVAAQRASQRGIDAGDDWSDSDHNSSEEDVPNRAGAAQLASLLFGGMPQPPARSSSAINETHSVVEAKEKENDGETESDSNSSFFTPSPQASNEAINYKDEIDTNTALGASSIPNSDAISASGPPQTLPPVPPQNGGENNLALGNGHGLETQAPPTSIPPPPPAPPAPPVPQAPPAPPAPPPPAPSTSGAAKPGVGGAPNLGALLGQIQTGKPLKKVDESQKKIAENPVAGRVL